MDIKIVDNFLDKIDLKRVGEKCYDPLVEWEVQRSISTNKENLDFLYLDVSNEEFYNKYLFDKVKQHLDGEYKLERIYFNGQWAGREGNFHNDECDITVLFYVSDYEYGWGGFTEIMTSSTSPTIIHPLKNRLLIFPGRIMHKGYSFSYQSCPMRVSLAFKLNTK